MPPSSPDEPSLPQRHRPNVDNLTKDTTERDLWDLDDLGIEEEDSLPLAPSEPIRSRAIPTGPEPRASQIKSRESPKSPESKSSQPIPVVGGRSSVTRRISKAGYSRKPPAATPAGGAGGSSDAPAAGQGSRMESTFDDLEHWDLPPEDAPAPAPIEEVFSDLNEETSRRSPAAAASPEPVPEPEPVPAPGPVADSDNEFEPKAVAEAKPVSLIPKFKLSLLEKAGLALLALILIVGGTLAYRSTFSRMAGGKAHGSTGFPVRGQHVTITKVVSYWRPPVTDGENAEVVRRGVVLIPVVEITASGQGAIRVLFSNDKGVDVGDPMIRQVKDGSTLVVAATAGFEDAAEHEAYRAGLTPSWRIKIAEAPTTNAAGGAFKELAEAPVDPNLK
ncbi:MAG: hypothetical protein K9M97_03725 [Akkermansiaceae bacterium]|nr:hypothetical protein [Akkermansiaceae bacterium]